MEFDKRYDEMPKKMVELAHDAWEDLMKEKMKQVYEDTPGEVMQNAAKVIVDHVMFTWEKMMSGEKVTDEEIKSFQDKLNKTFHG